MILITGATGKTGQAVIDALAVRGGHRLRALVQPGRQRSAAAIKISAQAEIMVGDLLNADTLAAAFSGVHALYHICPNVHGQIVNLTYQHFVLLADQQQFVAAGQIAW